MATMSEEVMIAKHGYSRAIGYESERAQAKQNHMDGIIDRLERILARLSETHERLRNTEDRVIGFHLNEANAKEPVDAPPPPTKLNVICGLLDRIEKETARIESTSDRLNQL